MDSQSAQQEDLASLEDVAIVAAKSAGDVIRDGFGASRASLNIAHKGAVDLVTSVDLAAEQAIFAGIRSRFPGHPILAEESGGEIVESEDLHWLIDPLDGTTNFAHRHLHCAVSIACLRGKRPVVGIVYDPMRDELFAAREDSPARLNGQEVSVSREGQLSESLLATGFAYDRRERPEAYIPLFKAFMVASQGVRRMGAAALDLAWVACGRVDGFWEANLNSWDVAAGMFLVERAGGRATTYTGEIIDVHRPRTVVASNGRIHASMVQVLESQRASEDKG